MMADAFERVDHPFLLFLVVLTALLAVSGIVLELLQYEMIAGFFGVYSLLFFVLVVLGYLFMAVIKLYAS